MGRTASSAQTGRAGERAARIAKARRRRLELDQDRAARDARIDQAVADAYLAQDERAAAMERVAAAEVKIGAAILRILAEGVAMPQVADLIELGASHVHKLKAAAVKTESAVARRAPPSGAKGLPPTDVAPAVVNDATPRSRAVDDPGLSTTSSSSPPGPAASVTLDGPAMPGPGEGTDR